MLDAYYKKPGFIVDYRHSCTVNHPDISDFHLHSRFEIYFFISGSVNYFIEKKMYPLKYGDLLVIRNNEIHKPSFLDNSPYERIVIHFDPSIPRIFNTENYDLLNCFTNRPAGEKNKINLSEKQKKEILDIFKRIEILNGEPSDEAKLLKLTAFIELLVFINRAFNHDDAVEETVNMPKRLQPILDFIENNLEGDLSLNRIEKEFYINGSYLSRLFKKHTGSNLHEYIIYKRISRAQTLISKGYSCTQACLMSGFNDYSNFSKIFKGTVGLSPQAYKKRIATNR